MKITAIKRQVKRAGRYSVFVDGRFGFGLSESALLESKIAVGQEIDQSQLWDFKKLSDNDKAYGNALRYVAMRPRSSWELANYFRRKKIDEQTSALITKRLQDLSMLDDLKFARNWMASRRQLKTISIRRLKLELKQKRISPEIIDQILAEDDSDERAVLRQLIAKKRARYPDNLKLMQYLARQGFSYDDIKSAFSEEN